MGSIVNDFSTAEGATGWILGFTFKIAQMIGVVTLIWGVYEITAAKKDGDGSQMTTAIIKVAFGMVFTFLPSVLRAVDLISY